MPNDWQFTNPFFEEGVIARLEGDPVCPYESNILEIKDPKLLATINYISREWCSGWWLAKKDDINGI